VPEPLQGIIGKKEIWRSLGTDSSTVAKRRALRVAAQIKHEFELARSRVGLIVDPIMLEAFTEPAPLASTPTIVETAAHSAPDRRRGERTAKAFLPIDSSRPLSMA